MNVTYTYQPTDWSYNLSSYSGNPAWFDRGFTGHEMLREFNLINMNARIYDPIIARMLQPDNYVQDGTFTQNYNRYSYVLNNPLAFTDPSGDFVVPLVLVIGTLVLTDVGYDIQKAVSPVAVHIDLDFGTHGNGIGLDVSVGLPQILPINYRYDIGASYYFNRVGGYGAGWQVRNGGEWGIGFPGFQLQYGGMRYRDWNGAGLQVDQVVHTAQIGNPLFNVSYSNDTKESFPWAKHIPFIPKLRDGNVKGLQGSDRYRTASGRIRVGMFELGFFLHAGEGDGYNTKNGISFFTGGNIDDPKRSNGIFYLGIAGFQIGWDSEGVRHALQNRFTHDYINGGKNGSAYPWVLSTDRSPRFVFQFGGF